MQVKFMKKITLQLPSDWRVLLVLLCLIVGDGCRRKASSSAAGAADAGSATESEVVVAGETGTPKVGAGETGSSKAVNLPPAAPITNNVAPPPRVDKATGKLILQTDGVILKKSTKTE